MKKKYSGKVRTAVVILLVLVLASGIGGIVTADSPATDGAGFYPGMMYGYGNAGYGNAGYGMMGSGGVKMMESVEIRAMGNTTHAEMQDLVTRMMAGSLDTAGQQRMVELMNQYPGPSNMMVSRLAVGYGSTTGGYPGMMGGYGQYGYPGMMGGGYGQNYGMMGMMNSGLMWLGYLLAILLFIVWLVVGILLVIWLHRQLRPEQKP
ncbi:MAG: hypothetical protein WC593_13470 [Methanoregula sp.]